MSQTHQHGSCCQNKKAYTATYDDKETIQVCISCFNLELKSKNYPDTLIKPFQRNAKKIICIYCNQDVTKTIGCNTCNPKETQS